MLGCKNSAQLDLFITGSLEKLVPADHILARVNRVHDLLERLSASKRAEKPGETLHKSSCQDTPYCRVTPLYIPSMGGSS